VHHGARSSDGQLATELLAAPEEDDGRGGGLGPVGPQGRGEGEVGLAFGPKQRRGFFLTYSLFYFLFSSFKHFVVVCKHLLIQTLSERNKYIQGAFKTYIRRSTCFWFCVLNILNTFQNRGRIGIIRVSTLIFKCEFFLVDFR
jgi:hypothetical protein